MLDKLEKKYKNLEKSIGGLKFAVLIILTFTGLMIIGTFVESYLGTEFAGRAVYKTLPFMGIQFFLFLSILFATFLRLPPKKRLYGFYVIHSGLILIACGSFVTFYSGLDGHITLPPNEPTRYIELNQDVLEIIFLKEDGKTKRVEYELPNSAYSSSIDQEYEGIKITDYFPFSQNRFEWGHSTRTYPPGTPLNSAKYSIYNDMVTQEFTVTLHPEAKDFKSTLTLGPLSIHYLPAPIAPCLEEKNPSSLVIWDMLKNSCFTPESRNLKIQKSKTGNRFLVVKERGMLFSFFPDFSPYPLDKQFNVVQSATMKIFSKKIFQSKPNLFLLGKKAAYYDADDERWIISEIKANEALELPWMGFKLDLLETRITKVPKLVPEYTFPRQENSKITIGDQKAVHLVVAGKDYWVTDKAPLVIPYENSSIKVLLRKKILTLPFELMLSRFKMKKKPWN
ncbi:MAG: hypothetical protein HOM21_06060 [Halobacteriovoraceae bacterium]|nr:hypothetical protein [Halobacteriovoraceae bacterium]